MVKRQLNDRLGLIAFLLQGVYLPAETILLRVPLSEAAAGYDTEFDLRHIQPTAMLWRVVKLQPPGYAPGLLRQPAHLMGEVRLGVPLRYFHMTPASGSRVRNRLRMPPLTYS